jgi:hypothetical protein
MQLIIFLVEVIAVYAFLEYDSLSAKMNQFKFLSETNSSYSTDNYIEQTLNFNSISDRERVSQWNSSSLKNKVLLDFPNLQSMSKTIESNMIDSSGFRERLISHIEYLHGEYILENITMKEYREKIQTIDPSLPTF